jgi:CO dehydrogenase nickel-insertion accessory protein CooC1
MKARVIVGAGNGDTQPTVDAWLAETSGVRRAILIEGAFSALDVLAGVPVTRLGAGCVCCMGQVPLRVGLTRLVRAQRPDVVLLVLASGEHLARVRALLADGSLGVRFEVN